MSGILEALRRDGFFRAQAMLPDDQVMGALASVTRTVHDQLRYLGVAMPEPGLHGALRALHRADMPRYLKTVAAFWRKADVAGLMRHPAILEFLERELGWRDVFLPGGEVALLMAPDLNIPGGYFGLSAHQDFPSVQGSLDGLVAWIPLTPVNRQGWTMEVVPGSHRRGLIAQVDETSQGWVVRDEALAGAEWFPLVANPGDVIFMSAFTVHRSAQYGDPARFRLALSTRFDNAGEPTFIARTYPTAYQRRVQRDQYEPGFPTQAQVDAIFG
jgi:hypothetical protein